MAENLTKSEPLRRSLCWITLPFAITLFYKPYLLILSLQNAEIAQDSEAIFLLP